MFPEHFITIPKTHKKKHTQICTNGSGKIVLACKFNDHQHFYRHRNLFRWKTVCRRAVETDLFAKSCKNHDDEKNMGQTLTIFLSPDIYFTFQT